MSLLTRQTQSRGSRRCCPEIDRDRTTTQATTFEEECGNQTALHHRTTTIRCNHVYNYTTKRSHVRKSYRSGTSTTLPGWRYHTGGSRSLPTEHPCPCEGRLWVARYTETTEHHKSNSSEPNTPQDSRVANFFTTSKTSHTTTLTTQPRPATQPPDRTPHHTTPNHRTTQPRITQPNHPTPDPSLTRRRGGEGGTNLPLKGRRGVDSRPGREEVANPPAEGEEGANGQPEGVECEPPPKGSKGKPPRKEEGGGEPPLKEEEVEEGNHHARERSGGGRRSEPTSYGEVEGIHFYCPFISFIKRGTAAPSKEGRGRKHHPKEAQGGSTTKRRRGPQR